MQISSWLLLILLIRPAHVPSLSRDNLSLFEFNMPRINVYKASHTHTRTHTTHAWVCVCVCVRVEKFKSCSCLAFRICCNILELRWVCLVAYALHCVYAPYAQGKPSRQTRRQHTRTQTGSQTYRLCVFVLVHLLICLFVGSIKPGRAEAGPVQIRQHLPHILVNKFEWEKRGEKR